LASAGEYYHATLEDGLHPERFAAVGQFRWARNERRVRIARSGQRNESNFISGELIVALSLLTS
jgi:hypothetical protein